MEVLHRCERLIEIDQKKRYGMNKVMEIFAEEKVHCFGLEFVADKIVFNDFRWKQKVQFLLQN